MTILVRGNESELDLEEPLKVAKLCIKMIVMLMWCSPLRCWSANICLAGQSVLLRRSAALRHRVNVLNIYMSRMWVAEQKQAQVEGYTQHSMVSSDSKTHRQRWMFPRTWKVTRADSERTNSLSSSATWSGQAWQGRRGRTLRHGQTGAPQVQAHVFN